MKLINPSAMPFRFSAACLRASAVVSPFSVDKRRPLPVMQALFRIA